MAFNPKSFQQIVADMAAKLSAETPINDYTPGSVILTLLEAASQEDYQQYVQMIELIRNYNLDTTEGEDLEKRAFEFGLKRLKARPHSGYITINDTRFTAISTKIYAGLPGPVAGSSVIYVDDASDFPSTGSVYVGRGTSNLEGPIEYSAAPVDNVSYWAITLDTSLVNDHGTDETIILSQFGVRQIKSGTEVRIPENDFSEEIVFELNQTVQLLDGVSTLDNVLVTALKPGNAKVPKGSIREFVNPPFTGATVYNYSPFVNGRDAESDQELRDRIRQTIQSLSRGTAVAIENGILGTVDSETNSSIVSAKVIPPVILADGPTKVYIDNGRGLEPEIEAYGLETLISSATGGERYFQLSQFPVIKANIISQQIAPFGLDGGELLIFRVGTDHETFTFAESDFSNPGSATAVEVAEAINSRATLVEARSMTDSLGSRVVITARRSSNEDIELDADSTANTAFNFSFDRIHTLKLYKNDQLLTKDGSTASATSEADPFDMSSTEVTTTDDVTITALSKIISKTDSTDDFREIVKPGDYVKASVDSDAFYTKVRTVVSADKLILETVYPSGTAATALTKLEIWPSPQLEVSVNGDLMETELVSFAKTDFVTPSQATATEILTRIQREVSSSKAELVTNDTKVQLTSYLENSADSKMRIVGGGAAYELGFCNRFTLTGTLTFNNDSREVTGSGTFFTQQVFEGQWIKVSSHGIGAWSKVETIEDDETLYLATTYNGASASGATAQIMEYGALSEGSNQDYTFNRSNGQIELVTSLVEGDSLTAGSINTRAFSDSAVGPFNLSTIGDESTLIVKIDSGVTLTVTTGDGSAPYNKVTSTSLIGYETDTFVGFYIQCTSGNNEGAADYVSAYDPLTGELTVVTGFANAILSSDQFVLSQVLTFDHSDDFDDAAAITATELVAVINSRIKGATAQVLGNGKVRIRTNYFDFGSLEVIGGSADAVLDFGNEVPSGQQPNEAFLLTGNTDREGLEDALGFTLSPSQSLVVVFDDDTANKTFTAQMRIEGVVDSGSANSFVSSELAEKYSEDDFFKGFWLYWAADSTNEGKLQLVTAYEGSTGTFTTADYFPAGTASDAPVEGDTAHLVPRTSENVVNFLKDLYTTTLSLAGNVEIIGNTGDYVQISSKRPGSNGKVLVRGGTANSIGIPMIGPIPGSPSNDVQVNSIAGLSIGMPIRVETSSIDENYFVGDIQGTTAPYTVSIVDEDGVGVDATNFTQANEAVIRDINGLGFPTTQVEGIDGYKYYSGLIQLAQWKIDGLDRDLSNYPGIAAAGTQFEVLAPILVRLELVVNVTPVAGVSLSSISNEVSSNILEYVNSLKVGQDVVLSEIIAAAHEVVGVFDVTISNLDSNVTIADGALARLADSDLTIG